MNYYKGNELKHKSQLVYKEKAKKCLIKFVIIQDLNLRLKR